MRNTGVRVAVLTLGCRVNQSESSVIEGTLRHHGISIVTLDENPCYCVINTCTVTGKSDTQSRQFIRRASKTGARIIVTGCYSQRKKDEVMQMDGVFQVVPSEDKEKIVSIILGQETEPLYHFHDRARPNLKVQDGCNFSCSYCAVPLARGRSRSLPLATAEERVRMIEVQGYHEIVLTGIHLGSYGKDLPRKTSLAKLIKRIITHTDIRRIRLSSLEINEVDDELLEVLGDARVCRHLHLPLQSGSDEILRRMNRNYSVCAYSDKISKILSTHSDIAIGTDVIVGFPGERDEDFEESYRFITDTPFAYLHVFPFSPRTHTSASEMLPKVSNNVIADRAATLKNVGILKKEHYALSQLNKILDVIIEEKDGLCHMSGTAGNYTKIRVSAQNLHRGTLVFIRSAGIEGTILKGFVIA